MIVKNWGVERGMIAASLDYKIDLLAKEDRSKR